MTLATIPRYSSRRRHWVPENDRNVVVVGGSMAGLLSSRVLSDYFENVTVLERDRLEPPTAPRRGVPQSEHVHILLEAGRSIIKDLFPRFPEAFLSRGGLQVDTRDFRFYQSGGYLATPVERLDFYSASRPFLESVVREVLLERPNVDVRSECQVIEYSTDTARGGVTGVRFRNGSGDEATLEADLVVDATGRTSKTPKWLERNGYESPPEDEVRVDVQYGTVHVSRPPEDRRTFVIPSEPPRKRALGMVPHEDDRWILTCAGVHGAQPPSEAEAFPAWVADLPVPEIGEVVADTDLLSSSVASHALPSNLRRRYEQLDRFPDGLLVVGDAVASFNPLYGQGMSVAALEALQLHHHLRQGEGRARPLEFFQEVSSVTDIAWNLAVGSDFRFDETTGPKPFGTDLINWYVDRLAGKAHLDGRLAHEFFRVMRMEIPPQSLFRPGMLRRVFSPV